MGEWHCHTGMVLIKWNIHISQESLKSYNAGSLPSNVVSVKGVSLRFCSLFWRELNVDGRVTRRLFGGKITKCCYWHYWWHQKSLAAATAFVKCISETRGKNLDGKKRCLASTIHCLDIVTFRIYGYLFELNSKIGKYVSNM